MRKVFDTKAGASFNTSSPRITYSVRQKELEIIFKFNKGFFCIINVLYTVGDKLLLAANWGKFFDVLQNPAVQMPKVEKNCPTFYAIMVGENKDGIFHGDTPEGDNLIAMEVPSPEATYLPELLTADVIKSAKKLADTVYVCYRELCDTPPFPGWKKQLDEIWND